MIEITSSRHLDENEIIYEFIKASGPGGQNVNKVSSAVRIRIDIQTTPALSSEEKLRIIKFAGSRITDDGFLIIEAKKFRTQEKNRQDAIQRVIQLFKNAINIPKARKKTRPSLRARAARILDKKKRGDVKKNRRYSPDDFDY